MFGDQPPGEASGSPQAPAAVDLPRAFEPVLPAQATTAGGEGDEPPAGVAAQGPREQEEEVTLSPKDLFGDVTDDVPPVPGGGLFDHPDDKEASS